MPSWLRPAAERDTLGVRVTWRPDNAPGEKADAAQAQAGLAPISPSQLASLRRGELEPDAAAGLVARTVGLGAPPAPPAGDLVPNESGWLIGAGDPSRVLPVAVSKRARWLPALSYLPYLVASELFHSRWTSLLLLAPAAVIFGAATFPRARLKQQLERAGPVNRLADVPDGTLVRVSGTILAQATAPTLFRGVPAVLFRNRMGSADETRGFDFFVGLDNGEQAKVAVRGSYLLERPTRTREPPACGPVSAQNVGGAYALRSEMLAFRPSVVAHLFPRYESSVGPGDRVEVCGVVRHVLAPELRSPREIPTRAVLGASEEMPLLVRRPVGG